MSATFMHQGIALNHQAAAQSHTIGNSMMRHPGTGRA
jgi:hypothetical protein